jgi:branched-chain amino acid transport system permease protein
MKFFLMKNRTFIITLLLLGFLIGIGINDMGQTSFIRTTLSGLTLGALFFMVASGLTLVFGLMDVLNFAHGATFMLGAYMGWQFYTNPTFLFGIAPLVLALITGISASGFVKTWVIRWKIPENKQSIVQKGIIFSGVILFMVGVWGLDILGLANTAMVAISVTMDPLAELSAQEPFGLFWFRPLFMLIAGLMLAVAMARPGDKTQSVTKDARKKGWVNLIDMKIITIIFSLFREKGAEATLLMNANLRFFLSLIIGSLIGAGFGVAMEVSLIRPLYVRPMYQVLVTLGIAFVIKELIQLLWQPLAYQMSRPPLFSQPGKAENLLAWFSSNNTTVDILGVTFPSYRLFIIFLGVLMFIGLAILMKYTRFGMIVRAGVQDSQMVEALGINVKKVFTTVFALGAGLAALGGIGAAF